MHLCVEELVGRAELGHNMTARAFVGAKKNCKQLQRPLRIEIEQNLRRIEDKIPVKGDRVEKGVVGQEELVVSEKCFR